MQASLSRVSTCRCLCESCRRLRLAIPRRAFRRSGTDGSNPVPSSRESTKFRFLFARTTRTSADRADHRACRMTSTPRPVLTCRCAKSTS